MDKNKIIEAAAKLVAKGAYDKAIKEYQKILDVDAKDVRILQKMGELYQKKNDSAQAAQFFTKVAESYANDGFFLKAVALYKQVLKLDPSLIDVNLKLAELHQQLQLMGEAMAYYQIVANHLDKSGDSKRSLETLKKMVELDPDNIASRIKLADLCARENMTAEAIAEYRRAADHLKRNSRLDDYVRVAERINGLEPGNVTLARELAEVYLQKQDHKRALAKLQICFKSDPRDVETLRLLATAFEGLGQTSKTISVYKELAKVWGERGRQDEVDRIWRQIEALDPNDAELVARRPAAPPPRPAPGRAAPAAAAPPAPAGGGGRPPPAPAAPAPSKVNISKLLTETDVYVKYGLHDKALEHLRKVFEVDPENIDAHEKAYEIYVASNNQAQAGEQLLNVLRLHTRRGDPARGAPFLQTILETNPHHPEVPAFVAVLRPGAAEDEPAASEEVVVDASEEEVVVSDSEEGWNDPNRPVDLVSSSPGGTGGWEAHRPAEDEPLGEGAELAPSAEIEVLSEESMSEEVELESVENDLPAGDEASQNPYAAEDDFEDKTVVGFPLAPQRDQSSTLEVQAHTPPEQSWDADGLTPAGQELSFDGPSAEEPLAEASDPFSAENLAPVEPEAEELVADDGAAPEYSLEEPPEESATSPREALDRHEDEALAAQEEQPVSAEDAYAAAPSEESYVPAPAEEAVEAPPEDEPAGEECDEASFFIDQGLFDEAREIVETVLIAYPNHRRAQALLARIESGGAAPLGEEQPQPTGEMPSGNGVEGTAAAAPDGAPKDAFDLAAELADELNELDTGASPEPSGTTGDFQVSFEEVFSEFKKGLSKVVKAEDVDTHYDLGIAYKEMGLIDDAIGEFKVARQGCVGKKKEVDCLTMQAMLQSMKGDLEGAIESYRAALVNETAVGDTELALRYELASAHESAGNLGKALGHLIRVQEANPNYRDVAMRVEMLSASASPEEDAPPPPPKPRGGGGPGGAAAQARKAGFA